MENIYLEIAELQRCNIPAALVTVISTKGSTPREAGAKMLVKADASISGTVGGAMLEYKAIQEALAVLREGKPRKVVYLLVEDEAVPAGKEATGMLCGGEMELFIEPLNLGPVLHLFGAGHVAQPTASLAAKCGFTVKVYDQRPEMASRERFPQAAELIVKDLDLASTELQPGNNDYSAIMTAGHDMDYIVLRNIIQKSFKYSGVISSRRKSKIIKEKLAEDGVPEERIARIHAPIGLDIVSETPDEIAVSIVAELIKVKNSEKQ